MNSRSARETIVAALLLAVCLAVAVGLSSVEPEAEAVWLIVLTIAAGRLAGHVTAADPGTPHAPETPTRSRRPPRILAPRVCQHCGRPPHALSRPPRIVRDLSAPRRAARIVGPARKPTRRPRLA